MYNNKLFLNVFRESRVAFSGYGLYFINISLYAGMLAILEVFSLSVLIQLIASMGGLSESKSGFGLTIINGILDQHFNEVPKLALLFGALVPLFFVAFIRRRIFVLKTSVKTKYEADKSKKALSVSMMLRVNPIGNVTKGTLESILNSEIGKCANMLERYIETLIKITLLLIYGFVAYGISPTATGFLIIFGIFLFYMQKSLLKGYYASSDRLRVGNRKIIRTATQYYEYIVDVRQFSPKQRVETRFERILEIRRLLKNRLAHFDGTLLFFNDIVGYLLVVCLFAYLSATGIDVAGMVMILLLAQKIQSNVKNVNSEIANIIASIPYLVSVNKFFASTDWRHLGSPAVSTNVDPFPLTVSNLVIRTRTHITDPISFELSRGDLLVVQGRSGIGKSTLLKTLVGQVPPNGESNITVGGIPLVEIGPEGICALKIFYLDQNPKFREWSLSSNVSCESSRHIDTERVAELLALVGLRSDPMFMGLILDEEAKRASLSTGELQRLALARALYHEPNILILDEALSGVDVKTVSKVIPSLIERFNLSIILTSHNYMNDILCASANRLVLEESAR